MKYEKLDIILLLSFLLVFSFSMSMLFGSKKNKSNTTHNTASAVDITGLATVPPQEAVQILSPLIASQSVEKIAESMEYMSVDKARDIARVIIQDKQSLLSAEEQQVLLFALALHYPDAQAQYTLFNLMIKYPHLLQGKTLLLVAAHNNYGKVIPALLRWSKQIADKPKIPQQLQNLDTQALDQAVVNNNLKALKVLYNNGVSIKADKASELLWNVVHNNKKPGFVAFLVERGADLHYTSNGYTLLMKATENNNVAMVKALITAFKNTGATPKDIFKYVQHIVDPQVGTALQIAIEKDYAQIDVLLRNYGARE